jgi:flagellar biosynthesis GTPase FlhF
MRQVRNVSLSDDLIELQSLLEGEWPARRAVLHASGVPLNEGEETDEEKAAREKAEADAAAEEAKKKNRPWGDDDNFDPDRAAKLIENTRSDRERLARENADLKAKLKEQEDAEKSEAEKAAERAAEAEKNANTATLEAMRLRVALAKGLTETQAQRLIGSTQEELEADADVLIASFKPDGDGGQDPLRRPTERLRRGAAPAGDPEENDPLKLAAAVPRS